jgi:hypothetical protein
MALLSFANGDGRDARRADSALYPRQAPLSNSAPVQVYLHVYVTEVLMGQVTLYVDAETENRIREAARVAGVSQSRWLADLIREKTSTEWPPSIVALAGAWADMPTAEQLREGLGEDTPREAI